MADRDPARGRQALEILGEALERPDAARARFVEERCGEDGALLAEVRSLLEASADAGGFFDGIADRVAEAAEGSLGSPPLVGRTIGRYRVEQAIGRGGMGEVYRALDLELDRDVALKILPRELAAVPKHVARFRHEARTIAALRHPKIAAIHDVEEIDGRIFLVLELVEGPTLAERLRGGALPLSEAVDVARQVAEALEAAHDIRIVHRDLKPANVKVDPAGEVRVLDFGIAKRLDRQRTPGSLSELSPNTPVEVTLPGLVLGTASYMSPEQARAKPIDHRSDIWSFGALLFELLTGRRAFPGEDVPETMARILEAAPDWSALPDSTPEPVRALLRRCLERDPRRRLQAIGEARIVLEDVVAGRVSEPAPMATGWRRLGPAAALAGAGGLLVGAVAVALLGPFEAAAPAVRTLRLAVAEDAADPVLSPTGDRVAFRGTGGYWVVSFDGSAPRLLGDSGEGYAAFWSPDGTRLGFLRDGALWRVDADGGPASLVSPEGEDGFSAAVWLDDGTILGSLDRGIVSFPEVGGEARAFWNPVGPEERGPRSLDRGPDGSLFIVRDSRRIARLVDGEATDIYETETGVITSLAYAPPGHVLFQRRLADAGIWALPLTGRGDAAGTPFLVSSVDERPSVSRFGDLAYLDRRTARQRRNLVWVSRDGETLGVIGAPQARLEQIDLSDSGRRALAVAEEEGRRRIWVHDVETGERYALSPMPDPGQRWPRWAPDESSVAFRFDRDGEQWVGVKSLSPGVEPVHLGRGVYPSFTMDGRVLVNYGGDILRLDPAVPSVREVLIASDESESYARPSSNGLVAFVSATASGEEVFVARYDDPSRRWQVSATGGTDPKWRADGRELFYLAGGTLMAVSVDHDGTEPRIGRPTALFRPGVAGTWGTDYDPDPSGERFLMVRALPREGIDDVDAIVLVQNWRGPRR